jgi:RHS repeat-associated protein
MVLMVFQSLADSCSASPSEESLTVIGTGVENDIQIGTGIVGDSTSMDASPALRGPLPGGTVESIISTNGATSSVVGCPLSPFLQSSDEHVLSIRTPAGLYCFNKSNLGVLTVLFYDGAPLVTESYFSLQTPRFLTRPANGRLISVGADSLVIDYDVVGVKSSSTVCGKMELSVNSTQSGIPKITVKVLDVSPAILDWNVVWIVSPTKGSILMPFLRETTSWATSSLVGSTIPTRDHAVRVRASSHSGNQPARSFEMNWSDAKAGVLRVASSDLLSGESVPSLMVEFPKGVAFIDPTIVASGSSTAPTTACSQRKTFWYSGYYWLFFNKGGLIFYGWSPDGSTWDVAVLSNCAGISDPSYGFDVAQRDGKVIVGWIGQDAGQNCLLCNVGTILGGRIDWSGQTRVWYGVSVMSRVSVAIGTDGMYWMAALSGDGDFNVYRSGPTLPLGFNGILGDRTYNSTNNVWFTLMPIANGNLAFLESWISGDASADRKVRLRYIIGDTFGASITDYPDSSGPASCGVDYRLMSYSAVAELSGRIHLIYRHYGDGAVYYSCYDPYDLSKHWQSIAPSDSTPSTSMSISLDGNNIVHILYVVGETQGFAVRYLHKTASTGAFWNPPERVYSNQSQILQLTSWITPYEHNAFAWSQGDTSPFSLMFANLPIPFGTAGAAKNPWDREGLSPYGTYFSSLGQDVAIGSGLLTLRQTDVAISGRGGLGLEVSRIYQQPKYFWKSNGAPFMTSRYPYCNLGPSWSLDLPWMDGTYVGVSGGQRFVIQWGDNGNPSEFENHDGVHFVLRDVKGPSLGGSSGYYELVMADGTRYTFNATDYQLSRISDSRNLSSGGLGSGSPNSISFLYSGGRLSYIKDSWLNRITQFRYNAQGYLESFTCPDGNRTEFLYDQSLGVLKSVRDPGRRFTNFTYTTSVPHLLESVVFPTGGKTVYGYGNDSAGTDVRSFFVTSQAVRDNKSNSLIRQTSFDYKIVGGTVRFTKVTGINETGVAQGRTEYVLQSSLKYTSESKVDPNGVQLSRAVTWYDSFGQPARVDTYKGASQEVNYSVNIAYDDWGNVIFSRDALGHETYLSFANTKTENSFQGGDLLIRSSSGKVLYDAFDNWSCSSWQKDISGSGSVSIDGTKDFLNAPSMMLAKPSRGDGVAAASREFPVQAGDFIIDMTYMTDSAALSRAIVGQSTSSDRLGLSSQNGQFLYLVAGGWVTLGRTCFLDTLYKIRLSVHPTGPTPNYDIYVDGNRAKMSVLMSGTGDVCRIRSQAGDGGTATATVWVDSVRIYKGMTVTVNGATGFLLELCDSTNKVLTRNSSGFLRIPVDCMDFPPGYIMISKLGSYSFKTPLFDIWGGDVYDLKVGYSNSSIQKKTSGFGRYDSMLVDDEWPSFENWFSYVYLDPTLPGEGDWHAVDYAASGTRYHESPYVEMTHYHGFSNSSQVMYTYSDDYLTQYIWLTDGKIPQEIVLQFFFNGKWHRAYWGGDINEQDCIQMSLEHNQLLPQIGFTCRIGAVPRITGQWIPLCVSASVWGDIHHDNGSVSLTGVIYGLVGGTARWDLTSSMASQIRIDDLADGQTAALALDDGTVLLSTASSNGFAFIDPQAYSMTSFPESGRFKVFADQPEVTTLTKSPDSLSITWSHNWISQSGGGMSYDVMFRDDGRYAWSPNGDPNGMWIWGSYFWIRDFGFEVPSEAMNIHVILKVVAMTGYQPQRILLRASHDNGTSWTLPQNLTVNSTFPNPTYQSISCDLGGGWTYREVNWLNVWVATLDASLENRIFVDYVEVTVSYTVLPQPVYESPWIGQVFNGDAYDYSQPNFYSRPVNGCLHHSVVGAFQYQRSSQPRVPQESFIRYDWEGDPIETKSRIGQSWTYARAAYDGYGNLRWSSDPTNRADTVEYSAVDAFTYPHLTNYGRLTETNVNVAESFETDNGWSPWKGGSGGDAFNVGYTTAHSYSPTRSVELSFANAREGSDSGSCMMSKKYELSRPIQVLSLRMYLESYHFTVAGATFNSMDSGVRLRLYDSLGNNYRTYTYWLACWYYIWENKTAPDPHSTKVIWGKPQMGTWLNPVLHPTSDFDIDWSNCSSIAVELYLYANYAAQDNVKVYYDDLWFDDSLVAVSADPGTTAYSYDAKNGLLRSVTDELGRKTNYSYDALGRMIWAQYADGSHARVQYDDANNKVILFDELNRKTVRSYDKIGRLIKVERFGGQSTNYSFVMYQYNWQDLVTAYRDELGHVTKFAYDFPGRTIKVTNPDKSYRTIAYNDLGNIVTYTDELGHKIAKVFDDSGRLRATREFWSASSYYETRMTYDEAGNLLTVQDAKGQTTTMSCDSLNRLNRTTYPDGLWESARYDDAGRILTKIDRAGNVTRSSYNVRGMVAEVVSPSDTVNITYDLAGQVTRARNNLGNVTYSYDLCGRVNRTIEKIGNNIYTAKFGFDAVGNLKWVLYPDGRQVNYDYDAFNRLIYVNKSASPSVQLLRVTYNVDDTIKNETFGKKQVTEYTYDQTFKRDWARSIITKNGTTTLLSLTYTYDAVGSIKYLVSTNGGNESYSYDFLNRLTRAWTNTTGSWGKISYVYDAVGNRLWKNETVESINTAYTYGSYSQVNKTVAGTTTWFYNYDKSGNQVWKNKQLDTRYNYQFNSLNQLAKIVKWTYDSKKKTWSSSTVGQYSYDANGARAKTIEGSYTTEYVYLGHDPLCEKNGTSYTDYVYANGQLKVKLVGTSTYFHFNDVIGSTWLTWKSGQTSATFSVKSYKPFGTPILLKSGEKVEYAGEIRDSYAGASPGLYYIGARWMDPELGRWLSLDPQLGSLSAPQTMDRYVYCGNNPLGSVDPTGSWIESAFDIGCIAYDIYQLWNHPTWGNAGWLALDVVCLIAPGVPALSPALKTVKWGDKAIDAGRTGDKAGDFSRFFKTMDNYDDFWRTASKDEHFYESWRISDVRNMYDYPLKMTFENPFEAVKYGVPGGQWFGISRDVDALRVSDSIGVPLEKVMKGGHRVTLPAGDYWIGTASGHYGGLPRFGGGATQLYSETFMKNLDIVERWLMWGP